MKTKSLLLFFSLTYAFTFGIAFLVKDMLPFSTPEILKTILTPLYRWGPALASEAVVGIYYGKTGLKQLIARFKVWRIGWQWYAFITLYPLTIRLLSVGMAMLFGETPPKFFYNQLSLGTSNLFLEATLYFIGIFIQAGLAEEIGWRGFALPQLLTRFNALTSSILLGLLWAGWHFHPINIDAFRGNMGWYTLQVVCMSVVFTWVFYHTGGSLLTAVLFHTFSNFSDWVVPIAPFFTGGEHAIAVWILRGILFLTSLFMMFSFGKNLSGDPFREIQSPKMKVTIES